MLVHVLEAHIQIDVPHFDIRLAYSYDGVFIMTLIY